MGTIKVHKIEKIKYDGKWTELFWEGSPGNSFDCSCKNDVLNEIIDEKEIYSDIVNNGISGYYVVTDIIHNNERPIDMSRNAEYILEKYFIHELKK